MRVLLDENMPHRLAQHFDPGVEAKTVALCGWKGTKNGALLQVAQATFDVFVTMDQGIPHQQNLSGLAIGVLVLEARSNRLSDLLFILARWALKEEGMPEVLWNPKSKS